jgi:hypothetical protein
MKLTEKELAARATPGAKPFEVVVGVVPGLRLSVQPSGLATARKVGRELYGTICAGNDPSGIRKAARRQERAEAAPVKDRVEAIAKRYLAHAKARQRAKTFAGTERYLTKEILPAWRGRRLSEITKADVRELVDAIAKRAPIAANRVLTNIKTLCNWAIEQDVLLVSPCAGLKAPAPETSRDRVFIRLRARRGLAGLPGPRAICRLER